ncbi:MAG: hypothetical protein EBT47_10850 [Chloroflexi bacterium]|nr:hypothetical protein [Chloroflexota bacterium]
MLARSLVRRLADPETPSSVEALRTERAKFLRAPVIVVVAVEPSTEPNVTLDEEIASGAAGVQNLLLAAHALGLAAVWRTGDSVRDEVVPTEFGFAKSSVIIGYVYLGYPDPRMRIERDERRTTRCRRNRNELGRRRAHQVVPTQPAH